jgi:hypothetical protein
LALKRLDSHRLTAIPAPIHAAERDREENQWGAGSAVGAKNGGEVN